MPLGTSTITATYEGDTNYAGSTSPAVSVTVVPSATPASGPLPARDEPDRRGVDLSAVSAVSPTDIWAVGFQGSGPATLTENFNGTSWSVVAAPNPAGSTFDELNGVSAVSSNAVWAVGDSYLDSNGRLHSAGRILQRHILEHPDDADARRGSGASSMR